MLTYMVRFHKLRFFPNLTGNYTITQYKEKQYITGYLNFNRPDPIDKVSKQYRYHYIWTKDERTIKY